MKSKLITTMKKYFLTLSMILCLAYPSFSQVEDSLSVFVFTPEGIAVEFYLKKGKHKLLSNPNGELVLTDSILNQHRLTPFRFYFSNGTNYDLYHSKLFWGKGSETGYLNHRRIYLADLLNTKAQSSLDASHFHFRVEELISQIDSKPATGERKD